METFNQFLGRKDEAFGQIGSAIQGAWQGMKQGWNAGQQPQQGQQQGQMGQDVKQFANAQSGLARAGAAIQDQRLKSELIPLVQKLNNQVINILQKYGMISQ